MIHDAEANGKLNGNKTEEKSGEAKYSNHTLEEVASMVNSTLLVFDAKVPCISYQDLIINYIVLCFYVLSCIMLMAIIGTSK